MFQKGCFQGTKRKDIAYFVRLNASIKILRKYSSIGEFGMSQRQIHRKLSKQNEATMNSKEWGKVIQDRKCIDGTQKYLCPKHIYSGINVEVKIISLAKFIYYIGKSGRRGVRIGVQLSGGGESKRARIPTPIPRSQKTKNLKASTKNVTQ